MKALLSKDRKKEKTQMSLYDITTELEYMEKKTKDCYSLTLQDARREKAKYGKNSSQIRMSLAMDLLMLKVIRQLKMLTESHRSMEEIYGIMGGLVKVSDALGGMKNPAGDGARDMLKSLTRVMENQDASGEKLAEDVNRLHVGAEKLGLNKYVLSEDILLNNEEIDQLISGADVDELIYRSTMDTVVNSADSFCETILGSISNDEEFSIFDTVEETLEESGKEVVGEDPEADTETANQEASAENTAKILEKMSRKELLDSLSV